MPNCELPIQTTAPGFGQETLPSAQLLPPVEAVPEGAGGDEATAEEAPAGVDGAAEDPPIAEDAPAGAEGAALDGAALEGVELPVTVCSVVIVRIPLACPLG